MSLKKFEFIAAITFPKAFTFLILVLLIFNAVSVLGQQSSRPDRGFVPNAAHDSSGLDSVNLQNGNLTAAIPLASLPSVAGNKLSFTLSAYYNSKLWDNYRGEEYTEPTPQNACGELRNTEALQYGDRSGWRIGGTYGLSFRNASEDFGYARPQTQSNTCDPFNESNAMLGVFFKPILQTPDGAEHELRILDSYPKYTGQHSQLRNYYRNANNQAEITRQIRMYSVDGSFLTVIYNPAPNPILWTIYTKDGTEIIGYRTGDTYQRIRDANGNSIRIYGAEGSTRYQDELTGREIRQFQDRIEYQTVGGAWQTIMLTWGTTQVRGKLYGVPAVCSFTTDGGSESTFPTSLYTELGGGAGQIPVLREIAFPTTEPGIAGQKFSFGYNSDATVPATSTNVRMACGANGVIPSYTREASVGLGELSEMTTPSGAHIHYGYSPDNQHSFGLLGESGGDYLVRSAIQTKSIAHDGTADTWNYDITTNGFAVAGGVTNPNGSSEREAFYPTNPLLQHQFGGRFGKSGLTYRTMQSNKAMVERQWRLMPFTGADTATMGDTGELGFNPVVEAEYTTLFDDAGNKQKMSAKKFQYDFNGNLLQTLEYDWFDPNSVNRDQQGVPTDVPTGAIILRTVTNSYYNAANDAGSVNVYAKRTIGSSITQILGATQEVSVGDSKTRISYDGALYGTAPTKGNATTTSSWDSANNRWNNVVSAYDSYGNIKSVTDARGTATEYFYEDSTHALPTKVQVDPGNGSGLQVSTTTFDFSTGAVLSTTDVNGNVSNVDYTNQLLNAVDPFARPGITDSPQIEIDGILQRRQTKTFYYDSARRVRVEADLNKGGDGLIKSQTESDQLGRTVLSERIESGGAVMSSRNVYLTAQRVAFTSNPQRAAGAQTNGWTRATSDILGRVIEVASFKGDAQPPATGTNPDWLGSVTTAYDANTKTVTDQAGKKRRGVSDALGRTTQVVEDPDNLNLATDYVFDQQGNIRKTQQGVQARFFLYDSLGRVIRARQPEQGTNPALAVTDALTTNNQWSTSYAYDENGNTLSTIDARNITVSGVYDKFNRLTARTYSDGTPAVSLTYENAAIAFSKGKLTRVSSSVSTTNYLQFDRFGGVLQSRQETGGQIYNFAYSYNLNGSLATETYPSGRTVRQLYDNDGDLSAVSGRAGSAHITLKNYASNFSYNAAGAIEKMRLGNGKWETANYNARGQITKIGLGNTPTDAALLDLDYDYGTAAENNGSLRKQKIIVPTIGTASGFTATQTYGYDDFNRLQSATEVTTGSQSLGWSQTFVFDRYGNRTSQQTVINGAAQTPDKINNPQVEPTTNRLKENQDADTIKDYEYDLAGSLTKDATGKLFAYDAEGRQASFGYNNSNTNGGSYLYDGQGKRVKKVLPNGSSSQETIFVYDAFGKLAAEYENQAPPPATTKYLTNDHLGSPRIVTDQNGAVVSRHDYQSYGEEITAGVGARTAGGTSGQQYIAADNLRQKFTGYERDTESGLDFAQARYYNSPHGRFTSVDPLTASASIRNPQTFNRYSYALNSPYKFSDPLGLIAVGANFPQRPLDMNMCCEMPVQGSGTNSSPPPTITVKRSDSVKYYSVTGATANDAIDLANKHFKGQFAGDTASTIRVTGTLGKGKYFNSYASPVKGGGYNVTAKVSDLTVNATTVVSLPQWDGYSSASAEDKKTWDDFADNLKSHEDGHVEINQQESENIKQAVETILPATSSLAFNAKTANAGLATASRSLNVSEISSAIQVGLNRLDTRNSNYERSSGHLLTPQQLKDKGITY